MLLHHVHGATSFEHLRTHENTTYATFRETVAAMKLLEDPQEVYQLMEETKGYASAKELRQTFAMLYHWSMPKIVDPKKLWDMFKEANLVADFMHDWRENNPDHQTGDEIPFEVENRALWDVQVYLKCLKLNSSKFYNNMALVSSCQ